jgi:hypothetical protein
MRSIRQDLLPDFTDFMSGDESSGELPSSSYRLGVRGAPLHELYSPTVTSALRQVCSTHDRP